MKTPEGFLLCKDVRFARTGELLYGAGQTPVKPGADGVARVTRDADVLFDRATLDSFVGKSVTYSHPPGRADVKNWRKVEAGTILSVRRGAAPFSDFMVGDIIVKDQETIDVLDSGARVEVSNGYDAAYEDLGNGRGRQTKITGNHLALLPPGTRGRCGSECYVGDEETCFVADQAMDLEEPKMTTTTGVSLLQKLFGAKDEAAVQSIISQATTDEAVSAAVAPKDAEIARLTADVARLTGELAEAKKAPTVTIDAAELTNLNARVVTTAEVLAPGCAKPTFDAADLVATAASIAAAQKTALKTAVTKDVGKKAFEAIAGATADIDKMTGNTLDTAFFGTAALMGAYNNNVMSALAAIGASGMADMHSAAQAAEDADKRSLERWGKK